MSDIESIVFIIVLQITPKRPISALPTEMVKVIVMSILTWKVVGSEELFLGQTVSFSLPLPEPILHTEAVCGHKPPSWTVVVPKRLA